MTDSTNRGSRLSVAPMMDRTDRHFRRLIRMISRRTWLYSEMVSARAVIQGDADRLLGCGSAEHPVALQLGGDSPVALARAAEIAADRGYDEVNLNVGCPSDRAQRGRFGACLMQRPDHVADCVAAMKAAVNIPVTVKHRIGVDDRDAYEDMLNFVDVVSEAGCDRFSIHARKAWLRGLSPKKNREVPPLRHEDVHRLARDRPGLVVDLNGGVRSVDAVVGHLQHVDGVMIGRWAWERPFSFAALDVAVFDSSLRMPTRSEVVARYLRYAERRLAVGARPVLVLRPLFNLFAERPGSRAWKRAVGAACRAPAQIRDSLAHACHEIEARHGVWRASA